MSLVREVSFHADRPLNEQLDYVRERARNVTKLSVILPEILENSQDFVMRNVLAAIDFFPVLKVLLFCAEDNQADLSLRQLSSILQGLEERRKHHQLQCVHFYGIFLYGRGQDYQELAQMFLVFQNLGEFTFEVCHVFESDVEIGDENDGSRLDAEISSMDAVFRSIASLPEIHTITISRCLVYRDSTGLVNRPDKLLHSSTVQQIFQCQSLRFFAYIGMDVGVAFAAHLYQQLERNNFISTVEVDLPLVATAVAAFSGVLKKNKTLASVYILTKEEQGESERTAQVSATRSTYKTLLDAVKDSSILAKFQLVLPTVEPADVEIFRQMMSQQFSLTTATLVELDDESSEVKDPAIDFYLKTNTLGRKRLIEEDYPPEHSSESFLIRTLAKAHDDLSCLYYFLRMKPAVICSSGVSPIVPAQQSSSSKKRAAAFASSPRCAKKQSRMCSEDIDNV